MPARKVIVSCAITGAIHTPSMSPHLPATPDDIAQDAIAAAEAGATILHLHARDPADGRPTQKPDAFRGFLSRIKQSTNAVINLTTGGSPTMLVAERAQPATTLKPEVASLNMGSMNFGLFPMLDRFKTFQHDWERSYLENSRDLVFRNTFKDIEYILTACAVATARASNSNATTPPISTTSPISSTANSSPRRCSCRPSSASSAASAPTPKTSCI